MQLWTYEFLAIILLISSFDLFTDFFLYLECDESIGERIKWALKEQCPSRYGMYGHHGILG